MILMINLKITFLSVWAGLKTLLIQKATWTWSAFWAGVFCMILPVEQFIFCSILTVVADSVSGWAASAKRGEGFQGSKMRESLVKLMLYIIVIITFYWVSRMLKFPFDVTYFVVSMISTAELMSILRNLSDYSGYDYESKVREVFPKLADFLPKSKVVRGDF